MEGGGQGGPPFHGKAIGHYPSGLTISSYTKPRTGIGSATTVHVSNSAITHGNERQNMAALVAGHCLHGAKPNRVSEAHSSCASG